MSLDVERVTLLEEQFGTEIELLDEDGKSVVHRLLAEFRYDGTVYAVLQSAALRKEQEVAILKVSFSAGGEPELETIEDDEEWETVAELYDEMTFPNEEQP